MNILVIAAHPDDEILGCGATMAKHVAAGDRVHVLIMAEGVTSRDGERNRLRRTKELSSLSLDARKAHKIIGTQSLTMHRFPDNRMDSVDLIDIVKVIEAQVQKCNPAVIYTHWHHDLNIDHQITHQAVLTACRPQPGKQVKKILCFEVPSSTEWHSVSGGASFNPNYFVDVSGFLSKKIKALKAYKNEMRPWPHARSYKSVEHLAGWRGASIGRMAAEAFMVERILAP